MKTRQIAAGPLVAILIGALAAACSDSDPETDSRNSASVSVSSSAPSDLPDTDACTVVIASEATELVGTPMTFVDEEVEGPISSCKYISDTEMAANAEGDPAKTGVVLSQLRVDIYDGSQFFDLDGVGYPKAERENLALGDRGFVHRGGPDRGVTVQFEIDETVFQVNYTETAILAEMSTDANRIADALVRLLQDRFARWSP